MTQKINHGEIWLANLNPNKGKEPGKVRPVLIVQDQALLDAEHPTTIIIPLTTELIDDAYPLRIRINKSSKLLKSSDLIIDQIRAIDNQRLIDGPLFHCDRSLMQKVYKAVGEVMGVDLI